MRQRLGHVSYRTCCFFPPVHRGSPYINGEWARGWLESRAQCFECCARYSRHTFELATDRVWQGAKSFPYLVLQPPEWSAASWGHIWGTWATWHTIVFSLALRLPLYKWRVVRRLALMGTCRRQGSEHMVVPSGIAFCRGTTKEPKRTVIWNIMGKRPITGITGY